MVGICCFMAVSNWCRTSMDVGLRLKSWCTVTLEICSVDLREVHSTWNLFHLKPFDSDKTPLEAATLLFSPNKKFNSPELKITRHPVLLVQRFNPIDDLFSTHDGLVNIFPVEGQLCFTRIHQTNTCYGGGTWFVAWGPKCVFLANCFFLLTWTWGIWLGHCSCLAIVCSFSTCVYLHLSIQIDALHWNIHSIIETKIFI